MVEEEIERWGTGKNNWLDAKTGKEAVHNVEIFLQKLPQAISIRKR